MDDNSPIQLALVEQQTNLLADIAQCYQDLSEGLDVSPARKFRLEGRLQVLLSLGVLSLKDLRDFCDNQQRNFNLLVSDDLYWQWACENETLVKLPFYMHEAPVYPSK